ncbi:MAG: PhoH family protein [Candidatus Aenigmatarchaeota archaeon]
MTIKPLTENQKELYNALNNERIIYLAIFGPTGSGKTFFVIDYALRVLKQTKTKKLIIVKPFIDPSTKKEFTLAELGELYFENIKQYLKDIADNLKIEWDEIEEFIKQKRIVFADFSSLIGRSFDDSIIFIDDVQLVKPERIVEILMRVGSNSRLIIAGDALLQAENYQTIKILREILSNQKDSQIVELGLNDIIRNGAKIGVKLLLETKLRKREMEKEEKEILDLILEEVDNIDIITVLDLRKIKKLFDSQKLKSAPDVVIVVKENQAGKIIGKHGQTIQLLENKLNLTIRILELTLDLREYFRVFHPAGKLAKELKEIELKGPYLYIHTTKEQRPIVLGNKGINIRFFEVCLKELLGVEVKVV